MRFDAAMREPFWVELLSYENDVAVVSQWTIERMRAPFGTTSYLLREVAPRNRPMRVDVDGNGIVRVVTFQFKRIVRFSFRQWVVSPSELPSNGFAQTNTLVVEDGTRNNESEMVFETSNV